MFEQLVKMSFRQDANLKTGANAYYFSRLKLEKATSKNMKKGARLFPGMTVSAEIVVGKISVISYLAWPLIKGLGEAIREP